MSLKRFRHQLQRAAATGASFLRRPLRGAHLASSLPEVVRAHAFAASLGPHAQQLPLRTATEQLLISNAVDQAVSRIDFTPLAGKRVYFDAQYLDSPVDKGYVVSSLRQHLLASGCLLQEERSKAAVEPLPGRHREAVLAEEADELDVVPGLLPHLAHRSLLGRLARLDTAARNRPGGSRAFVPEREQDPLGVVDEDGVGADSRVVLAVLRPRHAQGSRLACRRA